jgi:hypothetical protein
MKTLIPANSIAFTILEPFIHLLGSKFPKSENSPAEGDPLVARPVGALKAKNYMEPRARPWGAGRGYLNGVLIAR